MGLRTRKVQHLDCVELPPVHVNPRSNSRRCIPAPAANQANSSTTPGETFPTPPVDGEESGATANDVLLGESTNNASLPEEAFGEDDQLSKNTILQPSSINSTSIQQLAGDTSVTTQEDEGAQQKVSRNRRSVRASVPRIDFSKVPLGSKASCQRIEAVAAAAAEWSRPQTSSALAPPPDPPSPVSAADSTHISTKKQRSHARSHAAYSPHPPSSPRDAHPTHTHDITGENDNLPPPPEQLFDDDLADGAGSNLLSDGEFTQGTINTGKEKQVSFECSDEEDEGEDNYLPDNDHSTTSKPRISHASSDNLRHATTSTSARFPGKKSGDSKTTRAGPEKRTSSSTTRTETIDKHKPKKPKKNKGKGRETQMGEKSPVSLEDGEYEGSDLDYVHDPDDPAYEPDAEDYSEKAGPIPNECLVELDKAMYDFMTQVYSLGRRFGKRPQELLDACGYNYTTKRSDSTWNCFQAYMCIKKGWAKTEHETQADFVQRLAKAYEKELKSKLKHEWKRVDLRRVVLREYVDWYQNTDQEQMDKVKQARGASLREINKVIKECQKLGRVAYDAHDLILYIEIHDLNDSNHSKVTGYSPEFDLVMKTERVAWSERLKYHTAQFVVARSQLHNTDAYQEDPMVTEIRMLYESKRSDLGALRKMVSKLLGYDIKLATEGAHSRMHWIDWKTFCYANHLRLIDWPVGLAILGRHRDGHIGHSKRLSKPLLQRMMDARMAYWNALAKDEKDRTEEEQEIIDGEYMGPRIMAWTAEENEGTVDEGPLPLIIDENDDVILTIKDIISESFGDGEQSDQETRNDNDNDNNSDDNDNDVVPTSRPAARLGQSNHNGSNNKKDTVPAPKPKACLRQIKGNDRDRSKGNNNNNDNGVGVSTPGPATHLRQFSSTNLTAPPPQLPAPKPRTDLHNTAEPVTALKRSTFTSNAVAGPSNKAAQPRTSATNRIVTNAGSVVSNFVAAHRNTTRLETTSTSQEIGTGKGKRKATEDSTEGQAKKKNRLGDRDVPTTASSTARPRSPKKSYSR
ncbi:hypothetical protein K435DRAFT_873078 [Dendrothele bispora CBS 962.96]|uniref:Uncharacterized protein n=1 Tax=Dendrothele bispora (strain CBS 962.96) TaxID=1314807 RepID=A0A4S8KZW9_DENBC|nr:hypothetical protein K435DRAFT_873078 [Dendrothele bispora CBS 962.96]